MKVWSFEQGARLYEGSRVSGARFLSFDHDHEETEGRGGVLRTVVGNMGSKEAVVSDYVG